METTPTPIRLSLSQIETTVQEMVNVEKETFRNSFGKLPATVQSFIIDLVKEYLMTTKEGLTTQSETFFLIIESLDICCVLSYSAQKIVQFVDEIFLNKLKK